MEKNKNHAIDYAAGPDSQQVHLSDYIQILKKRKWLFLLSFAAVVTVVTYLSFRTVPVYRSTAQLILERQVPVVPVGQTVQGAYEREQDFLQTQYNLLHSRTLAHKVIEELELWNLFEAPQEEKPGGIAHKISGLIQILKQKFGSKDSGPSEGFAAQEEPVASQPSSDTADTGKGLIGPGMVNWYLSHLEITPVRGSRLVDVSFLGPDRKILPKIVTAHVNAFMEANNRIRKASAESAFEWIKTRLEAQKEKVEEAQDALYRYTKDSNIVSLEGGDTIVNQKLVELNSALTRARSERMAKLAVYRQLQGFSANNADLFSLPEMKRDPIMQSLRAEHARLKAQQLEMATRLGPKHPRMIELNLGIRQLEADIETEVSRLRTAIKAELDRALALEKSLERNLEEQKQIAISLNEKTIEFGVLKRQAESDQRLYDMLLQQAKEVNLVSLMDNSNARIVDQAEEPFFPIRPRLSLNIMMAVMLGLFLGTGLVFFSEYMDNTIKTPEELFGRLRLMPLGALPRDKSFKNALPMLTPPRNENRPALPLTSYPVCEIPARLPAHLPHFKEGIGGDVFLIESATMEEGKTTVACNLSANLARAGIRTLLMDCDFQRPRVHQMFGLKNDSGLANAIERINRIDLGSGDLSTCSTADLFFIAAVKKRSGVLIIKNQIQELAMAVYFQDGRLIHIQCDHSLESNRLGAMLLTGNFITREQLDDALERQSRTRQPLGYILVNAGYLKRNNLRGPLRLQMEEHLQKLFSWRSGQYTFTPKLSALYNSERIGFAEDYLRFIEDLGRIEGSRMIENELVSRICTTTNENLLVMATGTDAVRLQGPLNLTIITKIFNILKQRFDVIIVDSPPLDAMDGSIPLFELVNGVVLVVKAGHLSVKSLNQAIHRISREKIIGAVLNQVKMKKSDSYYKYRN